MAKKIPKIVNLIDIPLIEGTHVARENIPTDPEQRRVLANMLATKRNSTVLELPEPQNLKSHIVFHCPKHNYSNPKGSRLDFYLITPLYGRCCANANKVVDPTPRLDQVTKERGHERLSTPRTNKDPVLIKCLKHGLINNTIGERYLKHPYGMPCCGAEASARSRRSSVQLRIGRNPVWRVCSKMNSWRNKVRKAYPKRCFITNKVSPLETHHLHSAYSDESLRFNARNGIILLRDVHRGFHKWNGEKKQCTIQDFINFLRFIHNPMNIQSHPKLVKLVKFDFSHVLTLIPHVEKIKEEFE